jgi:hypothetical protein
VRQQAKQQFAAFLANYMSGRVGIVTGDGRPITLLPYTPVSCPGSAAQNIIDLVQPGSLQERMLDALYLNDNVAHRRAIDGVAAGLPFFGGGASTGDLFFGSSLDPVAQPDSFMTVELRFSHTDTQSAYRFLRLEALDGSAPNGNREYRYGGFHEVPFTCWDLEHNQQLDVGFVERTVTDATGTILGSEFQVATHDSTWGPDDTQTGGREYLFVFSRPYAGVPRPELAQDEIVQNGLVPTLYALWARLRVASDVIDDGDRFQFVWGLPPNVSVDQQLLELESQPLGDPDVQQAYADIVSCLGAINSGIGIGAVCDVVTAVQVSLLSASAQPDRAEIVWAVGGETGIVATIYRRPPGADWQAMRTASPDGSGRIVFEDRDVTAGGRYGYRLGIASSGGEQLFGETSLVIPTEFRLALAGFRPNPAGREGVSVAFTLATDHRATLRLYDVAGRRVFEREVGGLGAGSHVVRLEGSERLRPGVYLMRLEQDRQVLKTKAAIVR